MKYPEPAGEGNALPLKVIPFPNFYSPALVRFGSSGIERWQNWIPYSPTS